MTYPTSSNCATKGSRCLPATAYPSDFRIHLNRVCYQKVNCAAARSEIDLLLQRLRSIIAKCLRRTTLVSFKWSFRCCWPSNKNKSFCLYSENLASSVNCSLRWALFIANLNLKTHNQRCYLTFLMNDGFWEVTLGLNPGWYYYFFA